MAGFSHAEADRLRKVMTKKDRELEVADYREKFFKGAMAQGLSQEQIKTIWSMMLSFSGYSFCKAHSASYARVSYQAAYLKAHHPAEFMAAVISNQGGFYGPLAYTSEARRFGVTILPPDVNHSRIKWTGQEGGIRVGLMSIKDLGRATRKRIVSERESRWFADYEDFTARVRPDEQEVRALINAGALGSLQRDQDQAALFWQLARQRQAVVSKAGSTSPVLFATEETVSPPPLPRGQEIERLRRQFNVLGFLPDRHPVILFTGVLKDKALIKAVDLPNHIGRRVGLAGWLITAKTVRSKHDQPMQFTTFEDETGLVETTLFPQIFRRYHMTLEWGRLYILRGLVEENYGAVTLTVEKIDQIGLFH